MNNNDIENARMKLGQMNIDFTVDSFVEYAIRGDIFAIKLFLTAGMNINAKNSSNVTALIMAATNGHAELLKLLINNGAIIDKKDNNYDGYKILRFTIGNGHLDTLKILINEVDHGADIKNHHGRHLLQLAIARDNIEIVKLLLEQGINMLIRDWISIEALYEAACRHNLNMMKILIDKGANPKATMDKVIYKSRSAVSGYYDKTIACLKIFI